MITSLPKPSTEASRVKWVQFWLLEASGLAELREIAKLLKIDTTALANVIHGTRRTPKIQSKIARFTGRPIDELFGHNTHPSLIKHRRPAKRARCA